MVKSDNKRGLGRGLSALMADVSENARGQSNDRVSILVVPIEQIRPNPDQPRKHFSDGQMADLVSSVKEKGVLQPLLVREAQGAYQIIAGERRWRAAQQAQIHELPIIIKEFDDTEVLEVAIIENIQRADLNPIEEAQGYRQLMDKFSYTQEKLSSSLGKSRSYIANLLRLLQLPEVVQNYVLDGDLSTGHARALITSDDPEGLAKQVVDKGLSVRATEELVRKSAAGEPARTQGAASEVSKDTDTVALENDLSAATGVKAEIKQKANSEAGQLILSYKTLDDLDDLCRRLSMG